MSFSFKKIEDEGYERVAEAIRRFPSPLCDFSPFVILMWRELYKTEYSFFGDTLVLKLNIDGEEYFAINSPTPSDVISALKKEREEVKLSLVTEDALRDISESFEVENVVTSEDWMDYVYLHSDLSTLSGKQFSGQRNHINKFLASCSSWQYEELCEENSDELREFYASLKEGYSPTSKTAIFEADMVSRYLEGGYRRLPMKSGIIRADGKIVSFAFGEVLGDTLFVHIEKATREVAGAYPMIVKEFARHNEASFVNREEDMGVAGLRTSKASYHPVRLEKKYTLLIK